MGVSFCFNGVYIYNREQAEKPHLDWSCKKSSVTEVTE